MKDLCKRLSACFLAALMCCLCLGTAGAEGGTYTIGILQFAEHGSLDNCRTGLMEGLAEKGYVEGQNVTFMFQNAQADMGAVNQIAAAMAESCDLVCAIATPAAMAAFNACEAQGVPVVYTAVSDPVAAMLAREDGSSVGSITGTSDELPVEAQLKLIRAVMPEAKKIGILYTTSETNSESALARYEALAGTYGFEIVSKGVSAGADIPLALEALLPQVDCLSNLTDNTVVSYLTMVLEMAREAGKPVFGSEVEQVRNGCVASEGLEYIALGRQTGHLAARVLAGEDAGTLPFERIAESELYVNEAALASFGLTVPGELAERAKPITLP